MINAKLKKGLAIAGLTLVHLFATAHFSLWLFGYALAQHHKKVTPSLARAEPTVRIMSAIFEFPLVHLSRLIPYVPGSSSGRLVAFTYLLAYIANSILWAVIIYKLGALALGRRRK
ncbi:MAG TPA: hypothetical protein VF600_08830 [Abditibacteriaceae bacterium]|jgi:hypothetical protein